jgi:TP901 family phage tail tape measure protein
VGNEAVHVLITGNASGLVSATGQATGALGALESTAGRVGGVVAGAFQLAAGAALALGAAATAGVGAAIKVAASFDQQMSAVGAVANATAEQMKALDALALQLGKDTSFSAREAAQGLEELVKAGISVDNILGGAAKGALDLAAAGAVTVGEAATIASNAMNAFSLKGSDMAHVADVIAGTANASAIDVNQFKFSLAAVGAVAATVGISFEDTATAIGLLGNAGIKGSDAGTSLKTMLMGLTPMTDKQTKLFRELGIVTADGSNRFFDATGKAKGLADIAGVLQEATAGMTDQQRLATLEIMFGSDAIRAAAVLTKAGATGFNTLAESIGKVSAADVASKRLDNLTGDLEKFKGSLETAAIYIGRGFMPALRRLTQGATETLNRSMPLIEAFSAKIPAALEKTEARVRSLVGGFNDMGGAFGGRLATGWQMIQDAVPNVVAALIGLQVKVAELLGLEPADYAAGWDLAMGMVRRAVDLLREPLRRVVGIISEQGSTNIAFLTDQVLPPFVSILGQVGSFVVAMLPAFGRAAETARNVLGATFVWFADEALPPVLSILGQVVGFFDTRIRPSLEGVAGTLRGVLGGALNWVAATGLPLLLNVLGQVWDYLNGTVLPSLPAFANGLQNVLGGALTWVASTGMPLFLKSLTQVAGFIGGTVLPVALRFGAWLGANLPPALNALTGTVLPAFGKAISDVAGLITGTIVPAVQAVVGWLQDNLPPAIATAIGIFEQLRARVQPILTALFGGDFKAAVGLMGQAFVDLGSLIVGWIQEQVAKIDWAQVWNTGVDVVVGMAVWFADAAGRFATWLGEQVARIDWVAVWGTVTAVAEAMATWFVDLGSRFTTWLGEQAGQVDWAAVWEQTKITASDLADAIGQKLQGLDNELTDRINKFVADVNWREVGENIGKALAPEFQTGVDGAVTKLDVGAIGRALGDLLTGIVVGAWDQAIANWTAANPGEQIKNPIILALQQLRADGTAEYAAFWADAQGVQDTGTGGLIAGIEAFYTSLRTARENAHTAEGQAAQQYWLDAQGVQQEGTNALAVQFTEWSAQMTAALNEMWNTWVEGFYATWSAISDEAASWWDYITTGLATFVSDAWTALSEGWNAMWARTGEAWDAIYGLVTQKLADVVGALMNAAGEFGAAGWTMGGALVEAVKAALWNLVDVVMGPVNAAIGAVQGAIGGITGGGGGGGGGATGGASGGGVVGSLSNTASWDEKVAFAKAQAISLGLDPERFAAQLQQESGYNVGAVSSAGARGIGQFMPGTGEAYAKKLGVTYEEMVGSAELSIKASAMHMADLTKQFGDQVRAESAYFSGPGGGVWPSYNTAVTNRIPEIQRVQPATLAPATGERTGSTPSDAIYVTPIEGMGPAQPHWGNAAMGMGGTDIMAPEGTPVRSIGAAHVDFAGWDPTGGWVVMATGTDGKEYYYAHLKNQPTVKSGQDIVTGTPLGEVGRTGSRTGTGKPGSIISDTDPHLHLGIGDDIQRGVGPAGGTGTNFNAIAFLNDIRAGKYGGAVAEVTDSLNQLAASGQAAAGGLAGTQISAEQMVASFAPIAIAAADMGGQITMAADGSLVAMTMLADGSLTVTQDTAGVITAEVANMSGQVVGSFTGMSAESVAQVVSMGGGVAEAQASLTTGWQEQMAGMAEGTMTVWQQIGETMVATTTDAAGNVTTTVTDMAGNIISSTSEMAGSVSESFGQAGEAASGVTGPMGEAAGAAEEVGSSAGDAAPKIEDFGDVLGEVEAPDLGGVAGDIENIGSAAEDAADAVEDLFDSMGDVDFGDERQHGGPVWPGKAFTVGEAGRELFLPSAPGVILPHDLTERVLAHRGEPSPPAAPVASSPTTIYVNGAGVDSVAAEVFAYFERNRILREL